MPEKQYSDLYRLTIPRGLKNEKGSGSTYSLFLLGPSLARFRLRQHPYLSFGRGADDAVHDERDPVKRSRDMAADAGCTDPLAMADRNSL